MPRSPNEELAEIAVRAEAAMAKLAAERAELAEDFNRRGTKVMIRLAEKTERFEVENFDPMAVEVLEQGEAIQAHLLIASHHSGEVRLANPRFVPRSLDGVIALTSPAGEHPFLQGLRQIAVTGFSGEPTVEVVGENVRVEAEGLSVSLTRAAVESTDDELIITVLPAVPAK